MSNPHPIPLAIGALYELTKAAAEAAQTDVDPIRVDVGDPGEFSEWRAIGIGLSATQGGQVDDRQITKTLGYDIHLVDVACLALAWSGDIDDRIGWMTRSFELVDIVRAALEAPANAGLGLNRVVRSAAVVSTSFGWAEDGQGIKAQTDFTARLTVYRPRR